ncbi:MAG: hypothetical protein DWQ02_16500 [Bacteroidetes bacterium]|nr:MAG: hypothetical protein DWQ02_16500 [Bacteroidota bacterium]
MEFRFGIFLLFQYPRHLFPARNLLGTYSAYHCLLAGSDRDKAPTGPVMTILGGSQAPLSYHE